MGKKSKEKKERRKIEKEGLGKKGRESICLIIIRWGTYLILFTPLIVNVKLFFPFVGPKSLYFMGLTEVIFFSWLFLISVSVKYRPRFNLLFLALATFLVVLILASFFGVDPNYSFWSKFERMTGLLMWFHLFAFFLVISTVFDKKDWIKIFSVSIFVAVILSFISWLAKDPTMRGGATIGNDSFLGTYFLFNLFLALYLIFENKRGFYPLRDFVSNRVKIYSLICFFIIVFSLILSGARAAKLSFLGGLVLLFFLYLVFIPQKRYLKFLGGILLVGSLIIFLISIFFVFQPDNVLHQKFIEKTSQSRLVVWQGAWKGFLERPWLGWGPENFEFVFTKYFNPCMFLLECGGEIWFDRAHNIIFDTLIASGIFGLLAYIGIFLSVFYILWRNYFKKNIEFWTAGIFTVLLISYFVQNLTVFDMVSSYLMFFLVLGFVAYLTSKNTGIYGQERILPSNLLITAIILILSIFCFFNFIVKPLQTDYYVIQSLQTYPSPQQISFYKKSLESSSVGKYQIRTLFFERLEGFFLSQNRTRISQEVWLSEFDFLAKELEKNIKESPLDFRGYLRLGQLYNRWAELDSTKLNKAEEVLKNAIEISPTNQQGYWSLAENRFNKGELKEAFELSEKALALEPRLEKSHLIVIQLAKFMKDEDLIKKKTEEALKIIPTLEPKIKEILENQM